MSRAARSRDMAAKVACTAVFLGSLFIGGAAKVHERSESVPATTPEAAPVHVIVVPSEKLEYDQIEMMEEAEAEYRVTPMEVVMIAKVIYGEARGVESETEQAAIAWCILNRAATWDQTVTEVIETPYQVCYQDFFPTTDDNGRSLVKLAQDVVDRWERERTGETDVGRVLPPEYLWYGGDGERNWFRDDYEFNGSIWNWSLPSPYES